MYHRPNEGKTHFSAFDGDVVEALLIIASEKHRINDPGTASLHVSRADGLNQC